MARIGKAAACLLLLVLSGCKAGWFAERIAPEAIRDSKSTFDELRQGQVEQIVKSFDPSADPVSLRGELGKVVALVPKEEPLGVETLGATSECKGSGLCTKLITLEYKYPDRWVLFQVTTSNRTGHYLITDLSVQPESAPFESTNQSTFGGKGWLNYAMLLATLLLVGQPWVAFVGYALVGIGLAPVVPILFNAATKVPGVSRAAAIASASSIGYAGFMLGPPLIGVLAQAVSLTAAMGVVVVAAALLALGAQRIPA